jgi:hypothetical protein
MWAHPYTVTPAKLAPDLGIEVHLWSENDVITAWLRLDIRLRPLHTSILGMYIVFGPLLCCLKGIWVHPYTVTLAKLALDLGIQVHLKSGNDTMMSCLRLISTTDHFMHP